MDFLVTPEWLHMHVEDENVTILDCRFQLQDKEAGYLAYMKHHIPGAIYFDLEKDLSGNIGLHGGRHPIPESKEFVSRLEQAGISNGTTVVVYDDQDGVMAARCAWLLQYVGHTEVFLLDGGYSRWMESDYPVTSEIPKAKKGEFFENVQEEMIITGKEVRERLNNPATILVDSREAPRFLGEKEPIDEKAGHIPGAKNYFWKNVIGQNSNWKSAKEIEVYFKELPKEKEIIVYCGSGVSACPNILALKQLGYQNVKLYGGSWSDWISYADHEIAKG